MAAQPLTILKRCAACGREFRGHRGRGLFCSEACRQAMAWWRQKGVARLRAARAVLVRRIAQLNTIEETLGREATSGSCPALGRHPTITRETPV